MKNLLKRISLFLIAITSMIALVGCFTEIDDVKTLEFVNLPQSTYYKVVNTPTNLNAVETAYQALLGEITIRITDSTGTRTFTLKEAMERTDDYKVTINFDASILTTVGTKTIVITLGSSKLTYVFNVVEEQLFARGDGTEGSPYEIETPQQFINIGTRLFGVPVPTATASEDTWMYYYQFSFPYLAGGKHYKIMNDLDFTGVDYRTLGSLGGMNYIPFTGVLDGNNKKIMNLTVNTFSDSSSLFAALSGATVKDLTFTNIKIDSHGKYGAALFSQPGRNGAAYINIVDNVNVESGSIVAERFGGLAGEAGNTIFMNCTVGLKSNPSSLTLKEYYGANSAGIVGADIGRSYSYKTLNYKGGDPRVLSLSYSKIKELTKVEFETINGIYTNGSTDRTILNTKTLTEESTDKYSIVFYNCNVYALLYPASKTRGGVYTDPSSLNDFVFDSNNNIETMVKNSDANILIDVFLEEEMQDGYASVEYALSGEFDEGTYSYQVVFFTDNVFEASEFNLNTLNYYNNVYNIDGEVIEQKLPIFISGVAYKLTAYYFDAEGNIIGIYRETIAKNTFTLDETNRILTK